MSSNNLIDIGPYMAYSGQQMRNLNIEYDSAPFSNEIESLVIASYLMYYEQT